MTPRKSVQLSHALQQQMIDVLTALPNLHNRETRQTLLLNADLDRQLHDQINVERAPQPFITELVAVLSTYGRLADDRLALVAILEAAQQMVGQDKSAICSDLIRQIQASADSTAAAGPFTPRQSFKLTRFSPNLCNRGDHEDDFLKFFWEKRHKCLKQPQFYFVHGDDDEGHDSFIERLTKTQILKAIEKSCGRYYADVQPWVIEWPTTGNLPARQDNLCLNLIKAFDLDMPSNTLECVLPAVQSKLRFEKCPCAILIHNLVTRKWDANTEQLLRWYLGKPWAKLPCTPEMPQFLIFFAIRYPVRWRPSLWQRLTTRSARKKAIASYLCRLHHETGDPDPCQLIRELTPVTEQDVTDWFSKFGMNEPIRQKYMQRIFQQRLHASMAEVIGHLDEARAEYEDRAWE